MHAGKLLLLLLVNHTVTGNLGSLHIGFCALQVVLQAAEMFLLHRRLHRPEVTPESVVTWACLQQVFSRHAAGPTPCRGPQLSAFKEGAARRAKLGVWPQV